MPVRGIVLHANLFGFPIDLDMSIKATIAVNPRLRGNREAAVLDALS